MSNILTGGARKMTSYNGVQGLHRWRHTNSYLAALVFTNVSLSPILLISKLFLLIKWSSNFPFLINLTSTSNKISNQYILCDVNLHHIQWWLLFSFVITSFFLHTYCCSTSWRFSQVDIFGRHFFQRKALHLGQRSKFLDLWLSPIFAALLSKHTLLC